MIGLMEPRDTRTKRIILCGVWTGIGLCVSGRRSCLYPQASGSLCSSAGSSSLGSSCGSQSGSSGALRPDPERRRPADDGGASELGFITRGIRGDITPFGQSAKKRDP